MNRIKNLCLTAFLFGILTTAGAQQINWNQIENISQNNSKLYLIDFYTDWCGFCKKMDRKTFNDPTIIKIINNYYTPIKFNAEGNASFMWHGIKYTATPTPPGSRPSVHMFAKSVLGKQIGFPSFAIFKSDQTPITIVQGYQDVHEFTIILWYFASGDNKRYSFDRYKAIFDTEIRPTMNRALNIQK